MSFNMITNTVHCKVSFNGQIRRFALDGTEFTSLKETIARLLSLSDEFVLKYLDDESDYVTLSNKEELKTALIVSPTLLRILVDKQDAAPSTISDDCLSKKYQKRQHKDHEGKDHHGHHGHQGHHGNRGHHGHHGHKGHGPHGHGHHGHHGGHKGYGQDKHPQSEEERNVRIQKKLAWINQCLVDFGSDDSLLTPHALVKKQRLLKKKERIETYQKGDCYHQKKRQGTLTPEDEQKNRALKVQILSVKTDMAKLKSRIREIKMMLQDKVGDKPLIDELVALKEKKKLLSTQKRALVDQMHI
jgi:hypothetical protein